jgi:hypothetical protein
MKSRLLYLVQRHTVTRRGCPTQGQTQSKFDVWLAVRQDIQAANDALNQVVGR